MTPKPPITKPNKVSLPKDIRLSDWLYIICGLFISKETVYFFEERRSALCRWGFHDRAILFNKCNACGKDL